MKKELKKPLADRMRPKTLEEFVGQEHLMGEGKLLKTLLDRQDIPSLIFWGPSGTGKTSLGFLIGRALRLPFVALSAVNIGINEKLNTVKMNGREVFRFATRVLGRAAQEAVLKSGLSSDDIALLIPHQANLRIIQAAARERRTEILAQFNC